MVHVNETHLDYAMKVFSKNILRNNKSMLVKDETTGKMKAKDLLKEVHKEIEIMKMIDSESIVKLHEVIDIEDHDKLIMIIDFCARGEIMSWDPDTQLFAPCFRDLEFFSEEEIRKIMRDLLVGLEYLHQRDIVHRDIKPQNILLDTYGVAKLADFGSSEIIDKDKGDQFRDTAGTYHFFSPEMSGTEAQVYSAKAGDVWALGVTLYCLVFNKLPFYKENEMDLLQSIIDDEIVRGERQISDGLWDLLCKSLDKDPTKRPTATQLKAHPWVNEGYQLNLNQEGADMFANFTEQEIKAKGVTD